MENTGKLKTNELALVDVVCALFKSLYAGSDRAVKTDLLLFELSKLGYAAGGNTLRNVIGHIRRNDLLAPDYILSDINAGYWLSADVNEMSKFIDKQLNRMTNQYQNLKLLHHRVRYGKSDDKLMQTSLF